VLGDRDLRQHTSWSLSVEDPSMAKALLGHVGGPDPRVISEMRRLQRRVNELESELMRVRAENDALAAAIHRDELLTVKIQEPVLA
jgi:hypothetical protein